MTHSSRNRVIEYSLPQAQSYGLRVLSARITICSEVCCYDMTEREILVTDVAAPPPNMPRPEEAAAQEQCDHAPHRQTKQVINRLARIEGHVRAVKGMVRDERSCPDVLIQLAAVRSAVEHVSRIVLADHVESCRRGAAATGAADVEWERLKEALDRFIS